MTRARIAIFAVVLLQELGLIWFAAYAPERFVVYAPIVAILSWRVPMGVQTEVMIAGPHGTSIFLGYPLIPLALLLLAVALAALLGPKRP